MSAQPTDISIIDYRHSKVVAMRRADEGDETLEICAHCGTEVDVDVPVHRPGCPGIGAPRVGGGPVLPQPERAPQTSSRVEGLDLLEAMDDGISVASLGEAEHERLGPDGSASPNDEEHDDAEPVLGEVAAEASSLSPETGDAEETDLLRREPERPATSPTTGMETFQRLGPAERQVLDLIAAGKSRVKEIAAGRGVSDATVSQNLLTLLKKGLIVRVARGVYALADGSRVAEQPRAPEPPREVTPESDKRSGWIRVPGTGLAYRSVDEAAAAAAEVEADGARVSTAARGDGDDEKAYEALERARELACKIRAAAGVDGSTRDSSREGAADPGPEEGPRSPTPGIGERDDQQQGMRAPTPAASSHGTAGDGGSTPAPSPEAANASRALVVAALAAARAFADALEQELAA